MSIFDMANDHLNHNPNYIIFSLMKFRLHNCPNLN